MTSFEVGETALTGAIYGELKQPNEVLVRLHSACATSEIFGSLKCDCHRQLELAKERLGKEGGLLLYTYDEGRGIGLVAKLKAYALQDQLDLDTFEANAALGYPDDARDYQPAAAVLLFLGIKRVRLLTNNPAKVSALERAGLIVTQEPLIAPASPESQRYLMAKQAMAGHKLGMVINSSALKSL